MLLAIRAVNLRDYHMKHLLSVAFAFMLLLVPSMASAASATVIEAEVNGAVRQFFAEYPAGRELASKAAGMLVFPDIKKGGFIIGGEYGEGALRIGGRTSGYYSSASASIGFQAGIQSRSQIILFMTQRSLDKFTRSNGWEAGIDANVTVIEQGASGRTSTRIDDKPVLAYIFGESGLMAGVSLEGTKIERINP